MAEKRRNSAFWYRLAMGLLFAIVVVYTAYHLFSLFFSFNEVHIRLNFVVHNFPPFLHDITMYCTHCNRFHF